MFFRQTRTASRRSRRGPGRRGVVAVEAAVVLPIMIVMLFGIWEVGRLIQVSQIVNNAAREGARLAAGGYVNSEPVTSAMVTQAVRDYLAASGLPAATVSGAQVTITSQGAESWTDPAAAHPLDRFQITVALPAGAAYDATRWSLVPITSTSQMSSTVSWRSLNNQEIVVDTQLPY